MESSPPLALANEAKVRAALGQPTSVVLLNFSAQWCQPCSAFAPVLASLKAIGADKLTVLKVDIDACPELATKFGIRSIPITLLLRDGVEQDRMSGARSLSAALSWLTERNVMLGTSPVNLASSAPPPSLSGAFYGDASLREFLLKRLYRHMEQGQVQARFAPGWHGDNGTLSCALVHHSAPEVFERVTGLPYALACALEFLVLETVDQTRPILDALAAGADTTLAPLQFVRAWLGSTEVDWPGALDSAAHDALRREWLVACDDLLAGTTVDTSRWTSLRNTARALFAHTDDSLHQLENDLVTMLEHLSPPPSVSDYHAWSLILLRSGRFSFHRLLEYHAGWTKRDSALPALRERFFRQHVPIDATGRYDMALFERKRAEWERDNADF
ncbi:thioredoxin m(mitochondrial)-type, putative, partial [Ricinus communis]